VDEKQDSLLIVKDDVEIADMRNDYFRAHGYAVSAVNWGEDIAQLRDDLAIPCRANNP
jgi:DNA-binding response OmpR family regulator